MTRLLRVALLAAVVCGSVLAGVVSGVGAGPAGAVDDASVLVIVDSLTPLIPGPTDTLSVRGRVVSTARAELTNVSVMLRRSSAPLTASKDVAAVAASPLNPDAGDPDAVALTGTRDGLTSSLPPGGQIPFALTIPFADMGLTADGTYVLGVEVTGRESGIDTVDVRKGVYRTFLPWFPTPDAVAPISLVWLWPLAGYPARTATGVLLNDQTPVELSPGGRLDRLLALGERFPSTVSWIADPALLQTAADMSDGYQVLIDGILSVGDKGAAAERWLARLNDAAVGLRTVPYADIDASAVVRAGMSNDVVRAVTTGPGIAAAALRSPAPGGLYWAPFGRLDRNSANVLASAGVTSVIVSADSLPVTDQTGTGQPGTGQGEASTALPTSFGTVRAVLADPRLTSILALPQTSAADVITARQQFLAETALIATTVPADQTARTVVVAPSDMRWNPAVSLLAPLLRATRSAPWLASTSLGEVLDAPASSTSRQRGGYGQRARDAELPTEYMDAVARTSEKLASFTSIIDDPTGVSEPFSAAILRAESSAWRTDLSGGRSLVGTISGELGNDMSRVRVLSTGTITFSGDNGRVPVTITNDLDRAVTVGLALQGRPPIRLESEALTGIRIDAGKMASVDIDARVVGGDPLTVDVQLLDGSGNSYSRPAFITVTSTAYARAAAWVVAGAFVAILIFVVVGVTRRIRKAQGSRRQSDLGPLPHE